MAFWLAFGNEIIGGALLFRTRPKGKLYSLCFGAGWLAGCRRWQAAGKAEKLFVLVRFQKRFLFFWLAFGHEIRWCFVLLFWMRHTSIQPVL